MHAVKYLMPKVTSGLALCTIGAENIAKQNQSGLLE